MSDQSSLVLYDILLRRVDAIEMSVRTANGLKNASIESIGELVRLTENELLKIKNFGRKSIYEIKDILAEMELTLGMDIEIEKDQDSKKTRDAFWAIASIAGKLRMVQVSFDDENGFRYVDLNKMGTYGGFYVVSSETTAMKIAVEELEDLINNPSSDENDLQEYFERHPEFILDDFYKCAHSKIVLENKEDKKLIPDFILEPYDQSRLCDILDLKLPTEKVWIPKKNRPRFSSAVMEACAQFREYSNYFDQDDNRD